MMMNSQSPRIGVPFESQWCSRHWQVVLTESLNAILASVRLIQEALEDEEILRACGWDPTRNSPARVELINEEILKRSPLCCYLGESRMSQIYSELREEKRSSERH